MTKSSETTRGAPWATLALTACLAVAALYQSWSASKQVAALEQQVAAVDQQTLISHYASSARMLESQEIAVRIAGIQALEHLAAEQPDLFHLRTMRLLCAFIRHPILMKPKPRELRADVQATLDAVIYRSEAGRKIEEKYRQRFSNRRREGIQPLAPPVIDLSRSDLRWAKLYRGDLGYAILDGSNLSHAHGNAADFSHASLISVIAHKAIFIGGNFSHADMLGADWSESVLQHSTFVGAKMPHRLINTHLEWADLTGASFGAAVLTESNLEKTDLSGVTFGTAIRSTIDPVSGTRSRTKLYPIVTQDQLDSAIANPSNPPLLPTGLTDPTNGQALVWRIGERGIAWTAHRKLMEEALLPDRGGMEEEGKKTRRHRGRFWLAQ